MNQENPYEQTRASTGQKTEPFKQPAAEAGKEVAEQARQTARQLQDRGRNFAAEQKNRIAGRIHDSGEALHQTAAQLRERQGSQVAGYADAMAEQLDHVSDYLSQHELEAIWNDLQDVTRRHPGLVFGGMMLGGFALARLLKASTSAPASHSRELSLVETPATPELPNPHESH
jgi:hypothetical protein